VVQQQALRDLDQAWRQSFAETHRRPRWRRAGEDEGLRTRTSGVAGPGRQPGPIECAGPEDRLGLVQTQPDAGRVEVVPHHTGQGGPLADRVRRDPDPVPAHGTGGVDRGVAVAVALSTGEITSPVGVSLKEAERLYSPVPVNQSESFGPGVLRLLFAYRTPHNQKQYRWVYPIAGVNGDLH
jgi:putative transposase